MEKNSFRLAVLLLAFSVGITFAGISFYESANIVDEPVAIVDEAPPDPSAVVGKELEMVFVLDTTGSMGGLLDGAKQKIWGIVNEVMQKSSKPRVRIGLVAYRDRGDQYVTQILPLTEDLDRVYSNLMDYRAGGGGDTPEDVRKALAEGVRNAGWSHARRGLAQILFLVGDAPPQSYQNEPDVLATTAEAANRNIIINTIQCGEATDTRKVWLEIAQRGQGKFFAIAQSGGVTTIDTPFDRQLSELGQKIGGTYMAYGDAEKQATASTELRAVEDKMAGAASNSARADRSLNKAMNPNAYQGDLIQDIENGKVRLDAVKTEELPTDLKKMSADARSAEVENRLAERKKARAEIMELSKQRENYISAERKKSGKQQGFDAAVSTALSEQLAAKGIE